MKEKKSNESRRKLLKSIAAGSGAIVAGKSLPESWSKPIVDSVVLPTHAQTSVNCTNQVTGSTSFSYTGSAESWTVPAGICSITVEARGASGWSDASYPGGLGGEATTDIAVTPGETVWIYVGQQGQVAPINSAGPTSFNGGGNGITNSSASNAGGGGGASDVRLGGQSLADRIVVAGGGGGATGNTGCFGGEGGGLVGGDAGCPRYDTSTGGTQSAGGSAADGGASGSFGLGGNASDNSFCTPPSCGWIGGGGGGWYGGASGNNHQSGAGGSSYTGGQSGYPTSNASTTGGVQSGDGQVNISW